MYGALSAVDIESENLRWMGDRRFILGAIRELYRMQHYRVKLAYLSEAEGSSFSHPEGHTFSHLTSQNAILEGSSKVPPPTGSDDQIVPHETDTCADIPLTLESSNNLSKACNAADGCVIRGHWATGDEVV